ncbi:MAG: chromosome partitioning protein ParB, partial [Actinomycetota bacterium]
MARPTGLGRGLDALIPSRDSHKASRGGSSNDGSSGDGGSIDGVGLRNLPVKSISKNPNQP